MEFEEALYRYLSDYQGLKDLVDTRIYRSTTPNSPTWPALIFFKVSGHRHHAQGADTILTYARIEFISKATTPEVAKEVSTQVRKAIQDYHGMMGASSKFDQDSQHGPNSQFGGGVVVRAVLMDSDWDGEYEEEELVFPYVSDFRIWYLEIA